MKKVLTKIGTFSFLISLMFICTACPDDDKTDLKVNPTDISLLAAQGSSSNIMITTDGGWTASCSSDWIHLSSTSGNGNTTITISALSFNDSPAPRPAMISIQGGDQSVTVNVVQEPGLLNISVEADMDNMVILTKSVCLDLYGKGDVSYYKCGCLKQSASAGMTDSKVISAMTYDSKLDNGEDIAYFNNLTPNTDYYLYTVAFDEKGNQGPLKRFEFTTAKTVNNRPKISYGSVQVSSGQWQWSTQMSPYTTKYYMYATDDADEYSTFTSSSCPDAFVAYFIKLLVKKEVLSPMVQSGSWYMSKNTRYFYCASWAIGADGDYAGELDKIAGTVSKARAKNVNDKEAINNLKKIIKRRFSK